MFFLVVLLPPTVPSVPLAQRGRRQSCQWPSRASAQSPIPTIPSSGLSRSGCVKAHPALNTASIRRALALHRPRPSSLHAVSQYSVGTPVIPSYFLILSHTCHACSLPSPPRWLVACALPALFTSWTLPLLASLFTGSPSHVSSLFSQTNPPHAPSNSPLTCRVAAHLQPYVLISYLHRLVAQCSPIHVESGLSLSHPHYSCSPCAPVLDHAATSRRSLEPRAAACAVASPGLGLHQVMPVFV